MFPQTHIHTFNIHIYIPIVSRYVCFPRQTYIPIILDHTYIHTYIDGEEAGDAC